MFFQPNNRPVEKPTDLVELDKNAVAGMLLYFSAN